MKLDVTPPKTVLSRSDEQILYEISSSEWAHLKHLVGSISVAEPIHQNLATLFWGISIASFFSAFSLPPEVIIVGYPGKLVFWAICGMFFMSGIPCALYAYMQRDNINASKGGVTTYLDHLEEKFGDSGGNSDDD